MSTTLWTVRDEFFDIDAVAITAGEVSRIITTWFDVVSEGVRVEVSNVIRELARKLAAGKDTTWEQRYLGITITPAECVECDDYLNERNETYPELCENCAGEAASENFAEDARNG